MNYRRGFAKITNEIYLIKDRKIKIERLKWFVEPWLMFF